MNIDATQILQVITLGVTAWILKEVIRHGRIIAVIRQKMNDLPCSSCKQIKENGDEL